MCNWSSTRIPGIRPMPMCPGIEKNRQHRLVRLSQFSDPNVPDLVSSRLTTSNLLVILGWSFSKVHLERPSQFPYLVDSRHGLRANIYFLIYSYSIYRARQPLRCRELEQDAGSSYLSRLDSTLSRLLPDRVVMFSGRTVSSWSRSRSQPPLRHAQAVAHRAFPAVGRQVTSCPVCIPFLGLSRVCDVVAPAYRSVP